MATRQRCVWRVVCTKLVSKEFIVILHNIVNYFVLMRRRNVL